MDLIFELSTNFRKDFRLGKRCSVIADRREDNVEWILKDWQTHFSRKLWPTIMKDVRSSPSGSEIVTMMQPAKSRLEYGRCGFLGLTPQN